MSEPTHEVRLRARSVPSGDDVEVGRFTIREGESFAWSLGAGTYLVDPCIEVYPIAPARAHDPDAVELGVDWDHVLSPDIWRFIENALQTAAHRYQGESVVHSSESQRASYERLARRAEVIAEAIGRAVDEVDALER